MRTSTIQQILMCVQTKKTSRSSMARLRQRSRRLHEKSEGVQLQGHMYMVQVRKAKETAFTHKHVNRKISKRRHRSLSTSSDQEEEMMKCTYTMMLERGQRGTTTLNMPEYRKRRKLRAFQKRQRSGQDGNQRQIDEQKIEWWPLQDARKRFRG